MDHSKQLGEEKVIKLLFKFSIPAIVGMLVNALYNIVDRIFIGNGVGSLGIAGITIGFPVMIFIMACGMLIGIGANSLISIRLGQNKKEEAELILGNAFVLLVAISVLITVAGLIFIEPLLTAFGASPDVLPYAKSYMQVILLGAAFQSVGFGMNNFIRSEGNPRIAMFTMLIGAFINTALDPLFIYGFGWGMAGAAWATILSQLANTIWVMRYFTNGKSTLKFHVKNLKLDFPVVGRILALGSAPFAMQLAASLVNVIMNKTLYTYGGDIAISGMGVAGSISTLFLMPIFGINQGVQPIIGYNFGAKKYDRVRHALKLGIISATVIVSIGFMVTQLFPKQLVAMFNSQDAELIEFGARTIRIFMLGLPIIGFQIVSANYFQAVGKPKHAALLSLSRQVLVLIPAVLILPNFFGLNGALAAGPVADVISSILTGSFIAYELRHLEREHTLSVQAETVQ